MELQKLIDGLKNHRNGAASYESVDEAIRVFESMRDMDGEMVCKGLGEAQRMMVYQDCLRPDWISVKDMLPDDGKFVLVCNDDGKMMIAKHESEVMRWEYKYMNYDWDVWDDDEQGPVCYWMLLPEPPKEEEQ